MVERDEIKIDYHVELSTYQSIIEVNGRMKLINCVTFSSLPHGWNNMMVE